MEMAWCQCWPFFEISKQCSSHSSPYNILRPKCIKMYQGVDFYVWISHFDDQLRWRRLQMHSMTWWMESESCGRRTIGIGSARFAMCCTIFTMEVIRQSADIFFVAEYVLSQVKLLRSFRHDNVGKLRMWLCLEIALLALIVNCII